MKKILEEIAILTMAAFVVCVVTPLYMACLGLGQFLRFVGGQC